MIPNNDVTLGQSIGFETGKTILHRGGEELVLQKVADRFTVQPANPEALQQLDQGIAAQLGQSLLPAGSVEFTVDPAYQDQVMAQARNAPGINFASHVYQIQNSPGSYVYLTNQITIQFAPLVDTVQQQQIVGGLGLQLLRSVVGIANAFVYELTAQATANPVKLTDDLMQRSEVLTAEPNIVIPTQPHYRPTDTLYPQQWYLNNNGGNGLSPGSHISVESAWDITRGQRSVVVAVMDDSFDLKHPDFQGNGKIVAPKNFRENNLSPVPAASEVSHGTACAGLAIAEENGTGIVGVAPGCAFMPIRTSGFLDDDAIEQLFLWAMQNGASVISCSWGPSAVYFPLSLRQKAMITRATTEGRNGKGCVVVFAAGNANRPLNGSVNEQGWTNNTLQGVTNWLSGFTIHPDVITVSACTSLGKKAAYSNWGTNIAVCAPSNNAPPGIWLQQTGLTATPPALNPPLPGLGVLTTDQLDAAGYSPTAFTDTFGGTSSACPIVAGVAALMLSANPNLTAQAVKTILQQTADKIVDPDPDSQLGLCYGAYEANGQSQWFGYGKVNAGRAVQAAYGQGTPPQAQALQFSNNTGATIPDADPKGLMSPIQVNAPGLVQTVQVTVNLTHTFLGDISIRLIAPKGQSILLQGRTLGRQAQLQQTYTPQTTPGLKQLLNQPVQGIWQLAIVDAAVMDTGRLNSWQLVLG